MVYGLIVGAVIVIVLYLLANRNKPLVQDPTIGINNAVSDIRKAVDGEVEQVKEEVEENKDKIVKL